VIGYPSGQDGAILPGRYYALCSEREDNFFGVLYQSLIINPLLTKLFQSKWLDIGLVLFCLFMDLDSVSVHKYVKKELGQYPAILTSRLVNNPYVLLLSWPML